MEWTHLETHDHAEVNDRPCSRSGQRVVSKAIALHGNQVLRHPAGPVRPGRALERACVGGSTHSQPERHLHLSAERGVVPVSCRLRSRRVYMISSSQRTLAERYQAAAPARWS